MFNESIYYPYTSLKYHTLLTAALLDAYRAAHAFADLCLAVDPPNAIIPHRTVYAGEELALRIDADVTGRPTPSWDSDHRGRGPRRGLSCRNIHWIPTPIGPPWSWTRTSVGFRHGPPHYSTSRTSRRGQPP